MERHLCAFYDQPAMMKRMNDDLCRYNLACLSAVLEILTPDVMTFAEDLSYNKGPMLGRGQFEEFIAPYYRRIVPPAKARGIIPMIDTDGDVTAVMHRGEAAIRAEWERLLREYGARAAVPVVP